MAEEELKEHVKALDEMDKGDGKYRNKAERARHNAEILFIQNRIKANTEESERIKDQIMKPSNSVKKKRRP